MIKRGRSGRRRLFIFVDIGSMALALGTGLDLG